VDANNGARKYVHISEIIHTEKSEEAREASGKAATTDSCQGVRQSMAGFQREEQEAGDTQGQTRSTVERGEQYDTRLTREDKEKWKSCAER